MKPTDVFQKSDGTQISYVDYYKQVNKKQGDAAGLNSFHCYKMAVSEGWNFTGEMQERVEAKWIWDDVIRNARYSNSVGHPILPCAVYVLPISTTGTE